MLQASPGSRLREAYATDTLMIPGVFNAAAARIADRIGFHALYLSGAAVSAGVYALPDVGILSLPDIVREARAITASTIRPLLVDVDTGFGGPLHVERTVRELESAGAAGIQIEDQEMPKRCGHLSGKRLIPADDMVQKLRAAISTRDDPSFVIVARIDARGVTGLDDAVNRSQVYLDAGADVIFPEALDTRDEFERFAREVDAPLLANMTEFGRSPLLSTRELGDLGYSIVLFPVTTLRAALHATERVLVDLWATGTQKGELANMLTRERLYDLLDYSDFEARDREYFERAPE